MGNVNLYFMVSVTVDDDMDMDDLGYDIEHFLEEVLESDVEYVHSID